MSKFCFERICFGWSVEHQVEKTSRYLKTYVEMAHFLDLGHALEGGNSCLSSHIHDALEISRRDKGCR